MSSKVEIFNRALDLGGGRGTVSSETENSRESALCARWYNSVRDNVLKAAPWPCAKKWERLAVLAQRTTTADWTNAAPPPGWQFAYAIPSDCLSPRHLHSYGRFEQGRYANGRAIMTNEAETILAYTATCDDITLWDTDLEHAIVYMLAAHITYALQGKEGRWDRLNMRAVELVMDARTAAANAEETPMDSLPEWISARGFDSVPRAARFIYPHENLNMVLA